MAKELKMQRKGMMEAVNAVVLLLLIILICTIVINWRENQKELNDECEQNNQNITRCYKVVGNFLGGSRLLVDCDSPSVEIRRNICMEDSKH